MSDIVNKLFDQHLMGQAYKHITDQMGPNAQLAAFVNYDKILADDNGLESLGSLEDQHNEILNNIDNNNALESACEHFEDYLLVNAEQFEKDDGFDQLLGDSGNLDQLEIAYENIKEFGFQSSSFSLMKKTGLLAGTSFDALAIESFKSSQRDDVETHEALESLMDSIKEKYTAWSTKILDTIKKIGSMSFADIGNKIVSSAKIAAEKIGDGSKAVGRYMKAHPYKSALITVGTIAAAAALIVLVGQKLSAGEQDAALKLLNERLGKDVIRKAQGGVNATIFDNVQPSIATYISKGRANAMATWTTDKGTKLVVESKDLGWTKTNIISLGEKIRGLTSTVASAISTFVHGATKFMSSFRNTTTGQIQIPGVSKRSSHQAITSIFWMVYRLIKTQIGSGFHHIASLLLRLMGH